MLFAGVLLAAGFTATGQSKDPAVNREIVEAKNYVFKAQMVSPQRGIARPLTTEYDLTVTPDTVIAYLPYFGRAFTAPINPADGGIKFTSSKFSYTSKPVKKGGWEITIIPTDARDVRQLNLDIFDNGNASLRVLSVNKEQISFTGYIEKGKDRDKKAF